MTVMHPFPDYIIPTSRTYKPGKLPETEFTSRNGSTSFVQYGQNFVNAELTLNFANINLMFYIPMEKTKKVLSKKC